MERIEIILLDILQNLLCLKLTWTFAYGDWIRIGEGEYAWIEEEDTKEEKCC